MGDRTAALPERTREQRMEALAEAMAARTMRASVKRRMKRGEVELAAALDMPVVRRMRVRDLIASLPGCGKARAAKVMAALGIPENRRVGGLGPRQREALLGALG